MATPRVHEQDGVAVLDFGPDKHSLDETKLQKVQESVLEASNVDPPLLVVDMSNVDFFGSSFIEVLYRVWSRLQARGGHLALSGLSPYCREVIEVTKLDQLWMLYDTVDEAVAGVKAA